MEDSAKIGSYMRELLDTYESLRGRSPEQVKQEIVNFTDFPHSGWDPVLGLGGSERRRCLSRGLVRGATAA